MKINEYNQMMAYLTKPDKKPVIPKSKPKKSTREAYKEYLEIRPFLDAESQMFIEKELGFAMGGSVETPKRGLVDEPGSYSKPTKEMEKIAQKNIAKWKKANPHLDYDKLSYALKTLVRKGSTTAGTFKTKAPGIYGIDDIANLEGMPYTKSSIKRYLVGKDNKIQKLFKKAGLEILPFKTGQSARFKIINSKDFVEKLVDLSINVKSGSGGPQKFYEPYKNLIQKKYKELIKLKKPFSKETLRELVVNDLPEGTIKVSDSSINRMIDNTLNKNELKKFSPGKNLALEKKLEPRKKIIDSILKGDTNINKLTKISNLSKQEVGDQIEAIFRTIYAAREKVGTKEKLKDVVLKNYSLADYEKILKKINKEPTLDSYFQKSYRTLLFDAIGNPNNPDTYQPKKYARSLKRLGAYYKVRKELFDKFGITLELDHSLSVANIKAIKNNQPSQFLRVNPIPKEINRGIKLSFDARYKSVLNNLRSGKFRGEELKNLLIQKAELEKLSKDIGLPFGKMSPTGKIIKYDAVDFLNKNLPSEIKEGVSLPNRIRQAVDEIDPTVLKERFKVAFGKKADDALNILNKIKGQENLQDIYKFLKPLLKAKGLRVDASDFLNKISDTIVSPVAAAEIGGGGGGGEGEVETQPKLPSFKDTAIGGTAAALGSKFTKTDPLKKFRRFITAAPVRKGFGKILRGAGTPFGGLALAGTNVLSKMSEGQSLADAVVDPITGLELSLPGLLKENIAKITKNPRLQTALKLGKFGRMLNPVGLGLAALGQGQEFYNQYQALKDLKEQNPRAYEEFISQRVGPALSTAEQIAIEDMGARSGAAGGGIAKLAGIESGPQRVSMNPDSEGLDFLLKRGR